MLYVSRIFGHKWNDDIEYVVVDTDDGERSTISRKSLTELVSKYHMDIKGVAGDAVHIYQERLSSAQIKLGSLYGVDIRVRGNVICEVFCSQSGMEYDRARVRLSQFGKVVAGYAFVQAYVPGAVFILDDSLSVNQKSFDCLFYNGCVVDITEVTDENIVKCVYESNIPTGKVREHAVWEFGDGITDTPERLELWRAIAMIRGVVNEYYAPVKYSEPVGDYFLDEFKSLVKKSYQFGKGLHKLFIRDVRRIWMDSDFWRSRCQDYDQVKEHSVDVFKMLTETIQVNSLRVRRFKKYLKVFEPSDAVKQVYVDMCNQIYNWLLDTGLERGWIQ